MWNDRLDRLDDFPFRRLAKLLEGKAGPAGVRPIDLTIGEPEVRSGTVLLHRAAAQGHTSPEAALFVTIRQFVAMEALRSVFPMRPTVTAGAARIIAA